MKTIKQIAEEIGVSKQAVHKKRKSKELSTSLQPFTETVDGVVYISVDGERLLKSAFDGMDRKHVDANEPTTRSRYVDGETIIKILQSQLEEKDKQIAELLKINDQQQQLLLLEKKQKKFRLPWSKD